MVQARSYSHGNGSKARPYVLRYEKTDTLNGVRPTRRTSREKGKGWQRSRSSVQDYGTMSDIHFSEQRAMMRRGAAPSCAKPRPTGRKASCEKFCSTAKSDGQYRSAITSATNRAPRTSQAQGSCGPSMAVCGPPVQKRMMTCVKQAGPSKCVSKDDDFYGWAKISKDKALLDVHISDREGPKAKHYIPKFATNHEDASFPKIDDDDSKSVKCEQRRMELSVKTSSFRERGRTDGLLTTEYQVQDLPPYSNHTILTPTEKDPLFKSAYLVRLELDGEKIPPTRIINGRVYLDLKEQSTVEIITLDVNKTVAFQTPDGQIIMPAGSKSVDIKHLPGRRTSAKQSNPAATPETTTTPQGNEITTLDQIPKAFKLAPGTHAIPFQMFVPETEVPTYSYISTKTGASAINNYSVEALVRLNGKSQRTERIPFIVPAMAKPNVGVGYKDGSLEMVIPDKVITPEKGFDFAIGQINEETIDPDLNDIQTQLFRRVKIPSLNFTESTELPMPTKPTKAGKTNSVLDEYQKNASNRKMQDNWKSSFTETGIKVQSQTPSVDADGFTCDYDMIVTAHGKKYRGTVILADILKNDFTPKYLSQDALKKEFTKL